MWLFVIDNQVSTTLEGNTPDKIRIPLGSGPFPIISHSDCKHDRLCWDESDFRLQMVGSLGLLFLIALVGGLAMITLGLAIVCRTESKEFADGLLNAITFESRSYRVFGFRSMDHLIVQMIAQVLPLTHVLEADKRVVMLDDAGVTDIAIHLRILIGFCAVGMGLSIKLFKW